MAGAGVVAPVLWDNPPSSLIVTLVSAAGEELSWHAVPMAQLEGPVVIEPPDPDAPEELAFQSELRGEG